MADAAHAARETRVEVYADWLAHDVDGLTFNLTNPAARPLATAVLAEARQLVAGALATLDAAIASDKQSHREQEPA